MSASDKPRSTAGSQKGRAPGSRPQTRRTTSDPAREVAFDVVRQVEDSDAYANLVLPTMLRERRGSPNPMTERDAAFATELVYGTLRMRGFLDAVLAVCVDRPLVELDPAVLDLLRLGAYQLLQMRVPDHAAVAATVNLARRVSTAGPAGLVNAVLRKVSEFDRERWVERVAPPFDEDPLGHLAIAGSHPRWIVSAFREALATREEPGSWEQTRALIEADNERPSVTLVARPGLVDVEELLTIPGRRRGRWSPYAVVLESGAPWAIPQVRDGRVGVQDEGSQLVTIALTRVDVAEHGSGTDNRWLDLCAGPGGKAALLAGLAQPSGAHLVANELHEHRAELVRQALAPYRGGHGEGGHGGGAHEVVVSDGTNPPWERGSFDRVLVDAPCTGLGALRRRPESRWRRSPADLATLGPLQRSLLRAALDSVRPGGVVAYVTCSPHLAETELVVTDVIRGRDDSQRLDARDYLGEVDDLGGGPDVRLWPHLHGTDGMYLALLRRT